MTHAVGIQGRSVRLGQAKAVEYAHHVKIRDVVKGWGWTQRRIYYWVRGVNAYSGSGWWQLWGAYIIRKEA